MNKNCDWKHMTTEQVQATAGGIYSGVSLFVRDLNLPETMAGSYVPGRIIREKVITEASGTCMGMVTTHRFVILSNHMTEVPRFWADDVCPDLYAAAAGAHFKVLGQHTHEQKTGIFLLHLPDDESWELWQTGEFAQERQVYAMAVRQFADTCARPPVPELTTGEWLDRGSFPVGMAGEGRFWPLENELEPGAAQPASADSREVKHSRYLGCLLGGAVGDALGYPVEFLEEESIWDAYGPEGIQTLAQAGCPAPVSDDTQMTLFAANALIAGVSPWEAYKEWLGTQGDTSRMPEANRPLMWIYQDERMHAWRAPGNTCLMAIRNSPAGGTTKHRINNSKGCGTVMRAAPYGLAVRAETAGVDGDVSVYRMAMEDAALTHGHKLAWASSCMLAQLIYWVVQYRPERNYRLEDAISFLWFREDYGAYNQMYELLSRAVKLALDPTITDLDGIHALGEGWVAEEALAIAVFCAVRYQEDFAAAIRSSVNHKGDSDSTGAICGNILGAWLGSEAVEAAFELEDLELRDVIEEVANQLFEAVEGSDSSVEEKAGRGGAAPRMGKSVKLLNNSLRKMRSAVKTAAKRFLDTMESSGGVGEEKTEKLRLALDPNCTLPQALADWAVKGAQGEPMLQKYGLAFLPVCVSG